MQLAETRTWALNKCISNCAFLIVKAADNQKLETMEGVVVSEGSVSAGLCVWLPLISVLLSLSLVKPDTL